MDKLTTVCQGTPPDVCVCDQALRMMPNGDWAILFMTGGETEPRKENHIALCRSKDKGKTWSPKETVLKFPDKACTLSEAYVHGEQIRVFVQVHDGHFGKWQVFTIASKDSGKTWEAPVPFEPMPRRAFIRNLYISSWGTWYLPFQSYDTVPDEAADASPLDDGSFNLARNGVLMSEDEGQTWVKSGDTGPISGWAENNVVELTDGRMVMLIRTDGTGSLSKSESADKGQTWPDVERTDIPNPSSKFRLHRLANGKIVLVHNANVLHGVRNPLAIWLSDDNMTTWRFKKVVTDTPGQLQYPDGFVDEEAGKCHFAFDHDRKALIYVGTNLPDVMKFSLKLK